MELGTRLCCSDCGAVLKDGEAVCWLCGRQLKGGSLQTAVRKGTTGPSVSQGTLQPVPVPSLAVAWQFSLSSLFLLTTLVAVVLGVFLTAPGLGIALGIALAPALVREWGIAGMWRRSGRPLSLAEQGLSLLGSLLVVVAIAVSAATAFVVVCFPLIEMGRFLSVGASPLLIVGGLVFGIATGIAVTAILFYQLWLKWHFRFYREGKPPTLKDRVMGVLQTFVAHVMPFVLAYGAACVLAEGISQFGPRSGQRPDVPGYIGFASSLLVIWGLLACHSKKIFRALTYLGAFALGAALCLWLGAWVWSFARHLLDAYPFAFQTDLRDQDGTVVRILSCTFLLVGGFLGVAAAYRWPLPAPAR